MKILDAQKKFEDMIDYSEEYCYKYSKLHKKVCYSDLCVANIEISDDVKIDNNSKDIAVISLKKFDNE